MMQVKEGWSYYENACIYQGVTWWSLLTPVAFNEMFRNTEPLTSWCIIYLKSNLAITIRETSLSIIKFYIKSLKDIKRGQVATPAP